MERSEKAIRGGPGPGEIDVAGYRINLDAVIGKGTFGSVCQAHMITTGNSVAAKGILIADHWGQYDDLKTMALEEGEKMKACSHPNVVKLHEYFEHGNKVWLFMEFCDLGDLNHHLGQNPKISFLEKLRIMNETTLAISYLHQHDIVHRDIKPENILMKSLNERPVVKLGDFGYAKIYDYTLSQPTFSAKQNRSAAGTPAFSAPEFFLKKSKHGYTASVDVFSLGLIFSVVYNFGPGHMTTFPVSVESQENSQNEIFGREMAERYENGQPLPNLVKISDRDDGTTVALKKLIVSMTSVESRQRNKVEAVKRVIQTIEGQFQRSLNSILHRKLMIVRKVGLAGWPLSLNIIDGELWSCQGKGGIDVYDKELKLLRTMRGHGETSLVYSVALLPWKTVAVASRGHLYESSQKGDLIETIAKGNYCDLAVHTDRLYAAKRRLPAIHVYSCVTWQRTHSIPTPCKDIRHLNNMCDHRVCVNAYNIKLSCWDCNKIYILKRNLTFTKSYGPDITVQSTLSTAPEEKSLSKTSKLIWPRICQEDDDGAVLMTDSNNGLLALSKTGQWSKMNLNSELLWPRCAISWGGRLYVSTWVDEKLTMFQ